MPLSKDERRALQSAAMNIIRGGGGDLEADLYPIISELADLGNDAELEAVLDARAKTAHTEAEKNDAAAERADHYWHINNKAAQQRKERMP